LSVTNAIFTARAMVLSVTNAIFTARVETR
jgi:hypothetical protein